jgi:hypothetical protein
MPIEPDDLDIPPLPPPPVVHSPPPLRSQLDIVRIGSNARWGAVVAGVFVTSATWIMLQLFGMGLGGTVIWSVIAPIFAAFAGGLVVSRLAPSPNRWNRVLHGTLVWSVTAIAGVVAIVSLAAGLPRAAAWSTSPSVAIDDGESSVRGLGLDARDLVAPINGRLLAQGKPTMMAARLESDVDNALAAAVRDGRLDRDTLVAALSETTSLEASEIDAITTEVDARWHRTAQRAEALAARAHQDERVAADAADNVLLSLAIALLLGLVAANAGALATGHRDRRRVI